MIVHNLNHQKEEVMPRMKGMWDRAFIALCGVNKSHFNKKHGPCMFCGGKDRARFTDNLKESGDGGYICSQCGGDTGIGWFSRMRGENYSESINSLGDWLNLVPIEVISKANKRASRQSPYSFGAKADHEACEAVMQRTVKRETTTLSLIEGIHADHYDIGVKTMPGGSEEAFHAIPCRMVHEDGLDDEMCNIMFIDMYGGCRFMARDRTPGSVAVTGSTDKAIYLTCDWIDAQHIHISTGQEVWTCFTPTNIEMVAHRYKGDREMRVACLASDTESLYAADDRAIKVIIPINESFRLGMQRKLFLPADLLK